MEGKSLIALASLAGRTVVDAAAADEWETAQRRFALVLGRGDAKQILLAEQRLEETREQLIGASGTDVGLIRTALRVGWTGRLADFLEENPDTEADLQALVQDIQAVLSADTPAAANHAVSPNGAVSTADGDLSTADDAVSTADTAVSTADDAVSTADGTVSGNGAEGPGPDNPGALAARSELAYSTGQAGDAAAARDQFAALLPAAERILGPEHPDTLAARASLAYWTGQAGDAAAARDQFAALLPVAERILGPQHPDILTDRHNLANFAGYAGNARVAQDQFAALVPVSEHVLGETSPDTLAARASLAYWTGQAGDAAAARDQFATLLARPRAPIWSG